ncbi:MAG: nicotinate phosphoribosyltransferase [Deltaproteobacteria bacterium]|nr:nicotinate phosphoribosyltransferase [Deltaproteobacteria bacterium]
MTETHALHTDLYQLTMLAAYFHHGEAHRKATCELFVRRLPKNRRFLVVAGLERALRYLEELRFTDDQIEVLRQVPGLKKAMSPSFVEYLRGFRFRGDVWAMPEGTIAFENEPVVRVEADLGEAQLVETFLLSCINHQTMIASKAARIVLALKGRSALEFGTRRTHYDAAVDVARSAWIAGFEATSNVAAFDLFGIPARGTMAHMFIMAAESERVAFTKYSKIFSHSTYLVDTYDTLEGVKAALETVGEDVTSVRLDSGDLGVLSKQTRALLKERKREDVKIVLSSDLDEYEIETLVKDGDFDVAGVGTRLATSEDAPSLGGVYKLTQIDGRPVAKFAEAKITYPGSHQVFRHTRDGKAHFDSLGLTKEPSYEFLGTQALLVEAMTNGRPTPPFAWGGDETLATMRARCRDGIAGLPDNLKTIGPRSDKHEKHYEVRASAALLKLLDQVKADLKT